MDDIISKIGKIRHLNNEFLLNALKEEGVTGLAVSHGDIIFQLFKKPQMTMKELAIKINRTKSTLTTLVSSMLEKGLVIKETNPDDLRENFITLSPKGLALKPSYEMISDRILKKIYKDFTESEIQQINHLLNKIRKNME